MIVFGCSITLPAVYRAAAEKGFDLVAEPDSVIVANAAAGSLMRSYNLIMNKAAQMDDVEALVLCHQDAELTSPGFCSIVRKVLSDPDVGVVGCVGAIDARNIAWWEGSVTWGSFTHRYNEFGGGQIDAFTFTEDNHPGYARTGEADTLDGFILVMSPWAIQNVRFDESLGQLHGYDYDFCLQVREAGKKVMTADFKAVHHHSLELVEDEFVWMEAHKRVAEKWLGRMPAVGLPNWGAADDDWKGRALHAEADAGAQRLKLVSSQMKAEARARRHKAEMEEITNSISWQYTRPLRVLAGHIRRLRAARSGRNGTGTDGRNGTGPDERNGTRPEAQRSAPANLHAPSTRSVAARANPTVSRGSASGSPPASDG
jgi:Glycosyltransferase like family